MGWWQDENIPYGPGRNRYYAMAVGSIVLLLIITVVGVKALSKTTHKDKQVLAAAVTTTTLDETDLPFNPQSNTVPTTRLVTTTTVDLDYQPDMMPTGPEGAIFGPQDIAQIYRVEKSGLQQSVFDKAKQTAIALLTARVTGQGADRFSDFISKDYAMPKVKNLVIDGAYAEISDTTGYIHTLVWWHGENYYGSTPIEQGITGAYLDAATMVPVALPDLPSKLQYDTTLQTSYAVS